jgi:hypothetical protein
MSPLWINKFTLNQQIHKVFIGRCIPVEGDWINLFTEAQHRGKKTAHSAPHEFKPEDNKSISLDQVNLLDL